MKHLLREPRVAILLLSLTTLVCSSPPAPEELRLQASAPTPTRRIVKLTPLPTAAPTLSLSFTPTVTSTLTAPAPSSPTAINTVEAAAFQPPTATPVMLVAAVNITPTLAPSDTPTMTPSATPSPWPTATPLPPPPPQPPLTNTPTATTSSTPTTTPTPVPVDCGSPTNRGCLNFLSPQLAQIGAANPFLFTDQPTRCRITYTGEEFYSEPVALQIVFETNPPNYCGWGIGQLPGLDVSGYSTVSFYLKGVAIGQTFEFKIKDKKEVEDTKLVTVNSTDWTKIAFALNRDNFPNVNFKAVENINLGFNDSFGNVTIYVDDFIFE